MKFIPGGSVTCQRAVPREHHLSSSLAHLLLPQVRLALTNMLCSELGESQWLGFLGPGCSFIFLLQVNFHHQLVLDKKIQDRTGGGEEASRWLASSVAPCISEQHTREIVLFSAPLLFVCFSSPNLKRGFCMHPDNHLVNR